MNASHISLKTNLITTVLVIAVAGTATAGAVLRRSDNERDKQDEKPAITRRDDQSSDSKRPERPTQNTQDRSDKKVPDAEPSHKRTDRNDEEHRYNNDRNNGRDSHNYRDDRNNRDNRDNRDRYDDSKYRRVDERKDYRPDHPVVTYRPPVRTNGYYHYRDGWTSRSDFSCRFGNWVFDYSPASSVRSAYYYYDYFPYVSNSRVVVVCKPDVRYNETRIVIHPVDRKSGYYLEDTTAGSIDSAIYDVTNAWVLGRPDYLLNHIRRNQQIDVKLDGEYAYTINGDDYSNMTEDAILASNTRSFVFNDVYSRSRNEVVAYGTHQFRSMSGDWKTVYVSYVFQKMDDEWVITEVGSSMRGF